MTQFFLLCSHKVTHSTFLDVVNAWLTTRLADAKLMPFYFDLLQVDMVKESGGLQRALSEVDTQLQWLQQQPSGSMLRSIRQKISSAATAAATAAGSSSGGVGAGSMSNAAGGTIGSSNTAVCPNAYYSLGQLEGQLSSLESMGAVVDPCKYLPTPSWPALAVDLAAFAKGSSSTERQVFVAAAGSILSAHKLRAAHQQRQQQQQRNHNHHQGQAYNSSSQQQPSSQCQGIDAQQQQQQQPEEQQTMQLDQLLAELQLLAADPVPGVRCGVAAVAGSLLGNPSGNANSSKAGSSVVAGSSGDAGSGTNGVDDSSARDIESLGEANTVINSSSNSDNSMLGSIITTATHNGTCDVIPAGVDDGGSCTEPAAAAAAAAAPVATALAAQAAAEAATAEAALAHGSANAALDSSSTNSIHSSGSSNSSGAACEGTAAAAAASQQYVIAKCDNAAGVSPQAQSKGEDASVPASAADTALAASTAGAAPAAIAQTANSLQERGVAKEETAETVKPADTTEGVDAEIALHGAQQAGTADAAVPASAAGVIREEPAAVASAPSTDAACSDTADAAAADCDTTAGAAAAAEATAASLAKAAADSGLSEAVAAVLQQCLLQLQHDPCGAVKDLAAV
jgi:hypothetical protein